MISEKEFKESREKLIEGIRQKGIKNEKILDAMKRIPRELFVDSSFTKKAYEDTALPIECGQTISQPYTVAFMTNLLNVKQGDKILEIGTGSGYQATLLYMLGAEVYTIERHEGLFNKSDQFFKKYNIKVNNFLGDGSLGLPDKAPFDGIIVTAAAPNISSILKKQLLTMGKLVIPVGEEKGQKMYLIERMGENTFNESNKGNFKFVPLVGKKGFTEKWNK